MLETKTIEIRDRGTFIPAMATLMLTTNANDFYLIRRAGYGIGRSVILCNINDGRSQNDAYNWGVNPRTMFVVHQWLERHWDDIESGDVVDVEYILGERTTKKVSERLSQ